MWKIDIAFGAIMGFEFPLREHHNPGKWDFNLPKFLFFGLPSILISYYLVEFTKATFITGSIYGLLFELPPAIFMSHFKLFNMMSYVLMGYMLITCFTKQVSKGEALKPMRWVGIALMSAVAVGAIAHFLALNEKIKDIYSSSILLFTFVILLSDIAFGFLMGLEYNISKFRTGDRFKFDLPRLVTMSPLPLIIGLLIIIFGMFVLPKELSTTLPQMDVNKKGVFLIFTINYIEMFQIFFGLILATNLTTGG